MGLISEENILFAFISKIKDGMNMCYKSNMNVTSNPKENGREHNESEKGAPAGNGDVRKSKTHFYGLHAGNNQNSI
jgi:hypothetical protein